MSAPHVQHYIDCFERLTPATLGVLMQCFAERARFVDPFNDVSGRLAIAAVFEHMFATCDNPRFQVDEQVGDDRRCYLRWTFNFASGSKRRAIEGVSRVLFDDQGRVLEHIDYWDPARQLYETIPLLGPLLRALRRRLSAPAAHAATPVNIPSSATERKST